MSGLSLTVETLELLQDWADGIYVTEQPELVLALPPQMDLRWNDDTMPSPVDQERFYREIYVLRTWRAGSYEIALVTSGRSGELVAQSKLRKVR